MRSHPLLRAALALALTLAPSALRAQLVTDGGTAVINFSTNINSTVDIGTSLDNTLLVITNGGDVRNTGIAYIGRNAGSDFNRVFVNGLGSTWSNVSDLFIGFQGANNALYIQNGGTVSNRTGTLGGNSAGATNNRVVVDGDASLWLNQNDLEIGLLGGGNTVLVTNGGRVVVRSAVAADGTYLGHFAGAGNNRLIVSGTNSAFSNLFTLHHGYGAGGNLIRVENGGRLDTEVTYVGEFATASNNTIEVAGTNSFYRNMFEFVVGSNSAGNRLTISDGARLINSVGTLGGSATASNNVALVTGVGSLWSNSGAFFMGSAFNRLVVSNGGVLRDTIGVVGNAPTALSNTVVITGAGSHWSNSAGLTIGGRSGWNTLIISNDASVYNTIGTIGSAGGSNRAYVVNTDSWVNSGSLYVGSNSAGNQLWITNDGTVYSANAYIGFSSMASNNLAVVADAGSLWSNANNLTVGYQGANNLLIISNASVITSSGVFIGTSGHSNRAVVTGTGSLWSSSSTLEVGYGGSGNRLEVTDGGVVKSPSGRVGFDSTNNVAVIAGAGSLWSNANSLFVGYSKGGNSLLISSSAVVSASNAVYLGFLEASTNNRIVNSGGNLLVQNAAGTAVFDLRRGTNQFNSGLIDVDQLVMTNTLGVFEFNGGTLVTRGGLISNGVPFVVGASGSTPAIWDVRAGVSNMVVREWLIIGSNVANSQLLITNGGTLHQPGSGSVAILGYTTNSTGNVATISGAGSQWNLRSNTLYVGFGGASNQLLVSDGGTVRANEAAIGYFDGSNNLAVVTGPGSTWSNASLLLIGGSHSHGNQLFVSNSGAVFSSNLFVGHTQLGSKNNRLLVSAGGQVNDFNGYLGGDGIFGSTGNTAIIDGAGSLWRNANGLFVGAGGSSNRLFVTNGGTVMSTAGYVGYDNVIVNFYDNSAQVSGTGSLWSNATDLYVGYSFRALSNQLVVSEGGAVLSSNGIVGAGGSVGNRAVVTGAGSVWSNRDTLIVGSNSTANLLMVSTGGTVFASNAVYLSFTPSSPANRIEITDGNLIITNLAGNGTLDIRRGTNVLDGGLVNADRLFVTNALGRFEFLKGIFRSRYTEITNGFAFEVGNGTDIAFAELEGAGTHRFGNGLVIRSNGTVRARSTTPILSPAGINIQMGGTLLYQLGNQLAVATPLTLSGGKLDLGGNTQAAALGALTLSASSTIDLGVGGTQTLEFSSLASHTPGSLLVIQNWTGTASYGGGTDQILFTGGAGVTPGFLSEVRFIGFPDGALLLGSGEIVPTPEPATWLALAALGGTLLWRARRRDSVRLNRELN